MNRAALYLCLPALLAATIGFVASGCQGTDEGLDSLTSSTTGSGKPDAGHPGDAGAGGGGAGGSVPEGGAPKRTMLARNPLGHVSERENLLWDGDFEWSSPFSDEYGWLSGPPFDFTFPNVRIGSACHSGIKCAALPAGKAILGIAVAAKQAKLDVSYWAHLTKGNCSGVQTVVTEYQGQGDADATIHPTTVAPDADGWCFYESVIAARTGKPALYISNKSGAEVIVDDAVIKVAVDPPDGGPEGTDAGGDGGESATAFHVSDGPVDPALLPELEALHEDLLRLRGPHDHPPNAARRAFEAWKKR